MIKHTLRAARRALCPGLRRFSDLIEDVSEWTDSQHLTTQASLYVHVSQLWSIELITHSYAELHANTHICESIPIH